MHKILDAAVARLAILLMPALEPHIMAEVEQRVETRMTEIEQRVAARLTEVDRRVETRMSDMNHAVERHVAQLICVETSTLGFKVETEVERQIDALDWSDMIKTEVGTTIDNKIDERFDQFSIEDEVREVLGNATLTVRVERVTA